MKVDALARWAPLGVPRGVKLLAELGQQALCVFAFELLWLVLGSWRHFASVWELQWGSVWLAPSALCLLGLGLALSNAVVHLALRARRGQLWTALALAALAAAVAVGITQGRHFELWWRRAGFVFVAALAAGWVGYRGTLPLRQLVGERPRLVALAAFGLALGCEAANRWILVRLYPALHAGWAAAALLSFALGWRCWKHAPAAPQSAASAPRPLSSLATLGAWAWAGGWLFAALGMLPSLQRLSHFDNFRLLMLEKAPLLGQAVALGGLVAPPRPLSADLASATLEPAEPVAAASGNAVSFAGRDLLLVTIDAARADHHGVYGYSRNTSPELDRLAKEGVRFEYAYAATPHTSYSLVSLLTGKYIRPLLLQDIGADSDTLPEVLRGYGYRTAAFYPPAVFFIDSQRFAAFEQRNLGFEYQKKEFLEGEPRVRQVADYLASQPESQRLFVWVHLFGPHEPYELHSEFDFGPRDIDRYDSELAAADRTLGRLVEEFRARRPGGVVIVSADHGEEFGEHGGRYHGTTVYEEQVRVPLVVSAPGALEPAVVKVPVQSIDVMPNVLKALDIPLRPRIRGRDWSALWQPSTSGASPVTSERGFAYSETESQSLLAEGSLRLVCERKLGACRLYDLVEDPRQTRDVSAQNPAEVERLRARLAALNSSHGRYEQRGLRAEGQGWPAPLLRGLSGDGDAAGAIAELLDDADVTIRRKASEVLFRLRRPETAASLQLALQRDEDVEVRNFSALALTRLGQGASLTVELLDHPQLQWRRRAALALAEMGDKRGSGELLAWWSSRERDYEQSLELLAAFEKIREKDAVWPLLRDLSDVRLRPHLARTLAALGDSDARGALARALNQEPYQTSRTALAQALSTLGADTELVVPLRRWLGVPDPLQDGLGIATRAGILEHVGGPDEGDLARLRANATLGELVRVVIPKTGNGKGVRALLRATNQSDANAKVWLGLPLGMFAYDAEGKLKKARKVPEIHPQLRLALEVPPTPLRAASKPREPVEVHAEIPAQFEWRPGHAVYLVVLAERPIELESLALVPLQDELGPP